MVTGSVVAPVAVPEVVAAGLVVVVASGCVTVVGSGTTVAPDVQAARAMTHREMKVPCRAKAAIPVVPSIGWKR